MTNALKATTIFAAALCATAYVPTTPYSSARSTALSAQRSSSSSSNDVVDNRRSFLSTSAAAVAAAAVVGINPNVASASGGATAGKYTTIPIAKRRYYGRVQEAVHEFLLMGPDVIKGDMTAAEIQKFFDVEATVVVEAKKKDINGQCTKKDGDCRGREIRDSRYNDMKASMYLLGNAFRINQQKAPDNLPTVQAAKAFFKEMDQMEKAVVKKPKTNDPAAVKHYATALDILDRYLDLVELPPTDSGHYDKEFSTLVGESSRIT
eukprot:CAMPEP_0185723824 /NCGR_PEP_ID=MMETSP1171-20130828/533_1 /TAXON_ID=374046 /ORGANISM="Helicotheca tamensis, Strain CCMP826" /LENGTH=263 /DNA_ID=CAMNT_0028391579 /DNA_START=64 /DNA_END=855 /DNA_ORIENTATION=+